MTSWAADKVERKSVVTLIPYDRNPRIHPDDQIRQIADSIERWGWTIPILIDEGDNVIAGHGRLYAAQLLGLEKVPCMVAKGWTEDQKRSYVIADNKLAENSEWNTALYYSELKALEDNAVDLANMLDEDLSMLDFNPKVNPKQDNSEVTAADFDKAQDQMDGRIESMSNSKSSGGIEVTCPYCTESFTVTRA
jgi:hypothetical protein